ncbi:MAG: diaminopimelate decarboxylase [Planctomycetes bacterium]|nr:diaminopimelate decarboxylase [Planctomycetota bacterium]
MAAPDPVPVGPAAATPSEFPFRGGELCCEAVALAALAQRFGTPLYVYSGAAMDRRLQAVRTAFGSGAHVCYAVKANSNLGVLRRMHAGGAGFDLVSGGELERLRAAGLPTAGAVFAGVAKEPWEIAAAVAADILFFNVESPHELPLLAAAGAAAGRRVRVALRLNPDVDAGTHAYISTGKKENKFGVALDRASELVAAIRREPWLQLVGYHVHLGSQLQSVDPYVMAFERVAAFVAASPLHAEGITHYDLGGGFGIGYGKGPALDVAAVAAALLPRLAARGWRPVVEPGRFLVGDAGVLLTRVLGNKRQGETRFVLVDAAMNDLVRPALYQAEHPVTRVVPGAGSPQTVDVVGPVCETSDFLARRCLLPPCERGDLLAILAAGAYGASMASNYNTRRRPAEVLVDGDQVRLLRRRETFAAMFADEMPAADGADGGEVVDA